MPVPKKSPSDQIAAETTGVVDDVDLSGAPALRPPVKLRPGRKAKLLRVFGSLQQANTTALSSADALDLMDEALSALEPFAISSDQFEAWATDENNLDKILPLFVRHMEQMGEAPRSAS